jgi:LCP family protein required for cell wall assembly
MSVAEEKSGASRLGDQPRRRLDTASSRTAQPRLVPATASVWSGAAGGPALPSMPATVAMTESAVSSAVPAARRRWHRRPRYRRPRVVIPLAIMLIALIAAGAVVFSIHRTLATLHQVSTPAPAISGAALGGDDSVVIDTGPAQSAVAAASVKTATATTTATTAATTTHEPTATTVASATPRSPKRPSATVSATAKPSATATVTAVPTQEPATAAATETEPSSLLPPPPATTSSPTEKVGKSDVIAESSATPEPSSTAVPSSTATDEATTVPTVVPTETATETATDVPTAVPTDIPTATATEAVPTVEPTATVAISQIERIKNGGFEAGDDGWYLEAGAGSVETAAVSGSHALVIPAAGAWADQSVFFLSGTTYRLSVWGKVDVAGETGQVGVTYTDGNGQRLTDREPAPLSFGATDYEQQQLSFTVPDGVAVVKIFAWKGKGAGGFAVDNVSLRSIVPVSNLKPAKAASDDDAITILVMGVDARPGEPIDIGVRPDSLMVVRLDPETGSCRTLSIPRDTRTELPGYGQSKINHALAVGGIPYQQQVVENLLGLKIDHYVLIDFNGFQDLVDAVGGIKIDVPDAFAISDDMWFAAGEQTMDGKHALAYARYRGGPDGDFGRIARQQQVLRALIRKGASLNVVRSLNDLLPAVQDNLRTDLDAGEMARLGLDYRDTCTEDSVEMLHLDGYDAWFDDPLLNMQLEYVVVDEAEIRSKLAMLEEG